MENPALHTSMHRRLLLTAALLAAGYFVAFLMFIRMGGEYLTYGWGMFVFLPVLVGMLSVIWGNTLDADKTFWRGTGATLGAFLLMSVVLLMLGFEGVICLVMAFPLVLIGGLLGVGMGCMVLSAVQDCANRRASKSLLSLLAAGPLLLLAGMEAQWEQEAPLFAVSSAIHVNAPPERVWEHVVRFDELPPPTEWLFRTGIAYPVRARIEGSGVGAVRYCEFSTGAFVEPILVWDAPHHLQFAVTENAPPMREWTPWGEVHPPHLEGFLVSEQGEFRLTRLEDDTTLLEGTTWYRHNLWPAAYWKRWSDFIIHRIHLRVLAHVKALAEGGTAGVALGTDFAPKDVLGTELN